MKILRNFSISYEKDQNMLDYQISWDFVTKIVDFFPKDIFLGPVWSLSVGVYVRCERRESVPR